MNIKYTICFIRKKTPCTDEILMLYRYKEPNIYKWNGVGGKLEKGETPLESCLREVDEETGLKIKNMNYRGFVSWNNEGGMYVFSAEYDEGEIIDCDEGVLNWKDIEWVKSSEEVVSNISYFLDAVFSKDQPVEHAFTYNQVGDIIEYEKKVIKNCVLV